MLSVLERIQALVRELALIKEKSVGAAGLPIYGIESHVECIRKMVANTLPFAVCRCTLADDVPCKFCEGKGWLTARQPWRAEALYTAKRRYLSPPLRVKRRRKWQKVRSKSVPRPWFGEQPPKSLRQPEGVTEERLTCAVS